MIIQIPCPDCQQRENRVVHIPVNTVAFLQGEKFQCPECRVSIELMPDSVPVAAKGLAEYQQYQQHTQALQQSGNNPTLKTSMT